MKDIKKYMAGLAAAGLVMTVTGISQAFTSKQIVTETAAATVTGGSAQMGVTMIGGGTQIGWSNTAAGGTWETATQYLQIASTLTLAGAGIQTYTQNSADGTVWSGGASTTTAAGLVNQTTKTDSLPLAWQIVSSTSNNPVAADDPNCYGAGQPSYCGSTTGRTGYAWFYYADKGSGGTILANAPGNSYIQVESAGNPPKIQFGDNVPPTFGTGSPNGINNLYLETNFANATGGTTYTTKTLTLEAFSQ